MSRGYRKRRSNCKHRGRKASHRERQAIERAEQVQQPLGIEALTELARESLSSFAVEVGLRMAQCLLEDEVTQRAVRGTSGIRPARRRVTDINGASSRWEARSCRWPSRGSAKPAEGR